MICCDVCWIVLGESIDADDLVQNKKLHFVGKWEICSECLGRYESQILEEIREKRYKKN